MIAVLGFSRETELIRYTRRERNGGSREIFNIKIGSHNYRDWGGQNLQCELAGARHRRANDTDEV